MVKYAFLIGINYYNTEFELTSAFTDIRKMKEILIDKYYYKNENIVMLCDRTIIKPTHYNIVEKINLFIEDLQPGDIFLFYFSGHGKNKGIFTSDHKIILLEYIVYLFKEVVNTRLIFIFDCCYEGEHFMKHNIIYDYTDSYNYCKLKDLCLPIRPTFFSNVHVICSSTYDNKAYTGIFNEDHHMSIFTYTLLKILNKNKHKYRKSFKHLVMQITRKIKRKNIKQNPFLSCSIADELYEKFYI